MKVFLCSGRRLKKKWSTGFSYSKGALVAYWTEFYPLCQCVSVVSKVSNLLFSQEALCTVANPHCQGPGSTTMFEISNFRIGCFLLAIVWDLQQGNMQKIRKSPEAWNQCLGMTTLRAKQNLNLESKIRKFSAISFKGFCNISRYH